jgi:hypothetical protein
MSRVDTYNNSTVYNNAGSSSDYVRSLALSTTQVLTLITSTINLIMCSESHIQYCQYGLKIQRRWCGSISSKAYLINFERAGSTVYCKDEKKPELLKYKLHSKT